MSTPRIKGAAIREFLRWYAQRAAADDLARAVGELSPAFRALFDVRAEAMGGSALELV